MSQCLVCNHSTGPVISFGRMPIANGFLSPDGYDREFFLELRTSFCPNCTIGTYDLVDEVRVPHDDPEIDYNLAKQSIR